MFSCLFWREKLHFLYFNQKSIDLWKKSIGKETLLKTQNFHRSSQWICEETFLFSSGGDIAARRKKVFKRFGWKSFTITIHHRISYSSNWKESKFISSMLIKIVGNNIECSRCIKPFIVSLCDTNNVQCP